MLDLFLFALDQISASTVRRSIWINQSQKLMQTIDYIVLFLYFAGMAGIGFWLMRQQKKQEDFFMAGRGFGKLMQTFAAFGSGTGSADPVNTARGTFHNGMSGMWGVMYWLFVTPVYWISAVWYRRMRSLTFGDWFVERYESKAIGVAYALFGCFFYMTYGAMMFTAIGKVAAPLLGNTLFGMPLEYSLLPIVAVVVITYGLLGGISAAYWTDLIQGICIIVLSVMLIPFGLSAVVEKFGTEGDTMMDAFRLMHEQLGDGAFTIIGGNAASEFPLYAIVSIVIINMIGIVLTPHFIVTGGGTAKSEWDARVGLVTGNFIKRFCTIGWVITALIVLTLYGGNLDLVKDADKAWGVAALELLGPLKIGLVGLMVACLLAALMSTVDCFMIVCAALVVRNIYHPYIKPDASEAESLRLARIVGALVVAGSVALSLTIYDMFANLQLTWIVPMLFAAVFWVGMYWRRATTGAAWITFTFCLLFFFVVPVAAPKLNSGMVNDPSLTRTSHVIISTVSRSATPLDVSRGKAKTEGERITETKRRGGVALFWAGSVKPAGEEKLKEIERRKVPGGEEVVYEYDCALVASGRLRLDMLIIDKLGVNLAAMNKAAIKTLDLPFATVVPFLVMIIASLLTKRNSKEALDRLYVKMKTPVDPDPAGDRAQMEKSYAQPDRFDERKLFPGSSLEFQRPTAQDFWGFVACFAICFAIIGLAVWVSRIGT
ncbi:MAG: hypothetical protein CMO43_06470 [Verrucomicrobiales bacterium]|nr:hypothetical protein [Verrucomicrobiales bacterium]